MLCRTRRQADPIMEQEIGATAGAGGRVALQAIQCVLQTAW